MKLADMYSEACGPADRLVLLYDGLLDTSRKKVRTELRDKFYRAKLTKWPQYAGLWRSQNASIAIYGTNDSGLSQRDFTSDALVTLLKAALVLQMAAVDKVLHDAVVKRFTKLVKNEKLDDRVRINLSDSYQVAVDSQKRSGKGGRVRKRAGALLKAEVIDGLYRKPYLSLDEVIKTCTLCGKKDIFARFRASGRTTASKDSLTSRWEKLYAMRNHIAHECDIIRKTKARKVHFHERTAKELKEDIAFVKSVGEFISSELQ